MTSPETTAELTRYIEDRYHARHREQLPELKSLSAKVEAVHADSPDVPAGLADLLTDMVGELEVHMKKEELILFPAIRQGHGSQMDHPISVMRADHDDHLGAIAKIRSLTKNLTLPEHACGTWRRLYTGLGEFLSDIEEHIRVENNILFPQFESEKRAGPGPYASSPCMAHEFEGGGERNS
jgi:regulator of cell morphogenesis and NO signaling